MNLKKNNALILGRQEVDMTDKKQETETILKEEIIKVYGSRKRGYRIKEATERLKWKGSLSSLEKIVEDLKKEGLLITKDSRTATPQNWGLIPAQMTKLVSSFGFAKRLDNGEEMFIPGRKLLNALPGDIVLVEPRPQLGELPEGEIKQVVKPVEFRFTGVYHASPQGNYILSNKIFRDPVWVLPGKSLGAQDGDKVLAAVVQRGRHSSEYGAEVVQLFGNSQIAKNCCESILVSNQVQREFPQEAIEQAEDLCRKGIHPKELENRLDLRESLIFTIDGADSKDLDDAVSIEKTETGWKLGVHIADVSYYVTEKSPLDDCAYERGTSIYFADSVIPMLPEALSNGICSLNPNEDRLALSCLMDLGQEGELLRFRFEKTIIRSLVKGVYREVNAILDKSAGGDILNKYRPLLPSIQLMGELASVLMEKRRQRGGLELDSPEPKFKLDENGQVLEIFTQKRGLAEHIIEEFMLLANCSAAKFACSQQLPFIYRIHEKPTLDRMENLCRVLEVMGINAPGLRQNSSPAALTKIMDDVRGKDMEQIVNDAVIRSMAKAKYSPENKGHFGLMLDDYTHFTSPIRRYPDLSIHRIISANLLHMKPERLENRYSSFVKDSAQHSSEMELKAMAVERDCEDCYKAEYMVSHIGEEFDGVISYVSYQGLFVELPNTVEGLVRFEALPVGEYDVVEQVQLEDTLSGAKYRIGDSIRIIVLSADVSAGRVDFGLPGVEVRPKQLPPQKKLPKAPKHSTPPKGKKGSKHKHPRKKKKAKKNARNG